MNARETQYKNGERRRLSNGLQNAIDYLKHHQGAASLHDICRSIGYTKGATNLANCLRNYAFNHGTIHEVTVCGRKMGTWAYREPVISERMQRSIMDIPPLDMRCLGRPIIVVR